MNKGFYENDTDVIVIDEMGNLSKDVNTKVIKTKLLLENVICMVDKKIDDLKKCKRSLRRNLKNSIILTILLLVCSFGSIIFEPSLSITFKIIFWFLGGGGLLFCVNNSIKSVKNIKKITKQIDFQSDLLNTYHDDYSKVLDKEEDYYIEMFENNDLNEQESRVQTKPNYSYFFDGDLTMECVNNYQDLLSNEDFVDKAVKRKKLKFERKI